MNCSYRLDWPLTNEYIKNKESWNPDGILINDSPFKLDLINGKDLETVLNYYVDTCNLQLEDLKI